MSSPPPPPPPPLRIKPFSLKRRSRAAEQRSDSLSCLDRVAELTVLNASHFFFSSLEGDRINSKLVYAGQGKKKINLIQKWSGGQRHHLACLFRQIIAEMVSTLCTQERTLQNLTIQYTKGFCSLLQRAELQRRRCRSGQEDDSRQVKASPSFMASAFICHSAFTMFLLLLVFFVFLTYRKQKKEKSAIKRGMDFVSTIFRACKYSDAYMPGIVKKIPHRYHRFNWRFIHLLW